MGVSSVKDFDEADKYYQWVKDGTPDQWILYFEDFVDGGSLDFFWRKKGYKNLLDWVQAPVAKYGLGLDLDRFKHMLTFNPDYRWKWKPIVEKYELERLTEVKPVNAPHTGVLQKVTLYFYTDAEKVVFIIMSGLKF